MSKSRARKQQPSQRPESGGDPRFQVYGLWVVVQMQKPDSTPYAVQCPHGQPILYGKVVSRGDGFDPEAGTFRDLPPLGSLVAFEETTEGIEGHYFFDNDAEYRIVHLDVLNIAFPPEA